MPILCTLWSPEYLQLRLSSCILHIAKLSWSPSDKKELVLQWCHCPRERQHPPSGSSHTRLLKSVDILFWIIWLQKWIYMLQELRMERRRKEFMGQPFSDFSVHNCRPPSSEHNSVRSYRCKRRKHLIHSQKDVLGVLLITFLLCSKSEVPKPNSSAK